MDLKNCEHELSMLQERMKNRSSGIISDADKLK